MLGNLGYLTILIIYTCALLVSIVSVLAMIAGSDKVPQRMTPAEEASYEIKPLLESDIVMTEGGYPARRDVLGKKE